MISEQRMDDLRAYLRKHQRIVEHFGLDVERPLKSIELGFPENAITLVGKSLEKLLKAVWQEVGIDGDPSGKGLNDLIRPVRDQITSPHVLQALKDIQQLRNRAAHDGYELVEADAFVAIQRFTTVLGWAADSAGRLAGGQEIIVEEATVERIQFISGLYDAMGMRQVARFDLSSSTVYLTFEERQGARAEYVEILIGTSWNELLSVFTQTQGQILATSYPRTTRFVLVDSDKEQRERMSWTDPSPKIFGYQEFLDTVVDSSVLRLLAGMDEGGESLLPVEGQLLAVDRRNLTYTARSIPDVSAALDGDSQPNGNLAIIGGAGTGKSAMMRKWASANYAEGTYRFYIDLSERQAGEAFDELVARQLAPAFKVKKRLIWPVFQYLIRSGACTCYVDALDEGVVGADLDALISFFGEVAEIISEKSVTVVGSRSSFFLESPYVRQLLHPSTLVSEAVSHRITAQGVDILALPDFGVVRLLGLQGRNGVGGLQARLEDFSRVESGSLEAAVRAAFSSLCSRASVSPREVVREVGRDCLLGASFRTAASSSDTASARIVRECQELDLGLHEHSVLRELLAALYLVEHRHDASLDGIAVSDLVRSFVYLEGVDAGPPPSSSVPVGRGCSLVGPPGEVRVHFVDASFQIDRFPVTAGEYRTFLDDTKQGMTAPLHPSLRDPSALLPMWDRITQEGLFEDPELDRCPATCISWFGAWSYASWAGARLPTSTEWEIAARGHDGRIFPWGDSYNFDLAVCTDRIAGRSLEDWDEWRKAMLIGDVGELAAVPVQNAINVSPHGLVGMAGNVWEWTASCLPDAPMAVIAGGSYDNPLRGVRTFSKSARRLGARGNNVGFRLCRDGGGCDAE